MEDVPALLLPALSHPHGSRKSNKSREASMHLCDAKGFPAGEETPPGSSDLQRRVTMAAPRAGAGTLGVCPVPWPRTSQCLQWVKLAAP